MQNAELFESFEPKVKEFAKFQGFIEKTKAQSSKFAAKVVEKLIKKHTDAAMGVVEDIMPLLGDVEEAMNGLSGQKDEIAEGRSEHQFNLDVLKLELAIEQLTKGEFEKASKDTQSEIEGIDEKLGAIEEELGKFSEVMGTWTELGTAAGVLE